MTRIRPVRASASSSDAGFSMVEALVALAVFALAGVGLVQLQTHSVSTLQRVETRALAGIVAQNLLVDAIASRQPPDLGATDGEIDMGGRRWRWRRLVEPTADPGLVRVTVTTSRAQGVGEPLTVHAFRVIAAE